MIRAFAGNIAFILVIIPLIIATNLTLEYFFNAFNTSDLHITNLLGVSLTPTNNWLNASIVLVLLSLNAILINFTFNSHEFFERNTYLPSLLYIILVGFFPLSIYVNGELIAQTFAILAINQVFNIRQNEDARRWMFNTGFFLGLAFLFNPVYGAFLIVTIAILFTIRPFILREFALGVIGFTIPIIWLLFYQIESGNDVGIDTASFIQNHFGENAAYLDFDRLPYWIILSPNLLVIPLLIFSMVLLSKKYTKSSIRFKRLMQSVLYFVIAAILIAGLMFITAKSYYYFSVGAVVLPLILPYGYLEPRSKTVAVTILYLMLALHIIKFIV
jgi:hypothetical protein